MFIPQFAGVVLFAASAVPCAIVPFSGEVIKGPYAECRAAALEVRFQLTEVATSQDTRDIVRSKLTEFALAQAANLDVCETRDRRPR